MRHLRNEHYDLPLGFAGRSKCRLLVLDRLLHDRNHRRLRSLDNQHH